MLQGTLHQCDSSCGFGCSSEGSDAVSFLTMTNEGSNSAMPKWVWVARVAAMKPTTGALSCDSVVLKTDCTGTPDAGGQSDCHGPCDRRPQTPFGDGHSEYVRDHSKEPLCGYSFASKCSCSNGRGCSCWGVRRRHNDRLFSTPWMGRYGFSRTSSVWVVTPVHDPFLSHAIHHRLCDAPDHDCDPTIREPATDSIELNNSARWRDRVPEIVHYNGQK